MKSCQKLARLFTLKMMKVNVWLILLILSRSFWSDYPASVVAGGGDVFAFVQQAKVPGKITIPDRFSNGIQNKETVDCFHCTTLKSKRWMMPKTTGTTTRCVGRIQLSNGLPSYFGGCYRHYNIQHKATEKGGYLSKFEHYSTSSSGSDGSGNLGGKILPRIKKGGSFKDLVTQSTIFADKSLFIKTVIEDSSTGLLITMPRRWGKTVNLDMLKRFVELLVDDSGEPINRTSSDNYKLFAGGQIDVDMNRTVAVSSLKIADALLFSQTKALDVQGTYPVIFISLMSFDADDYISIEKELRALLSECFGQHAYLQNSSKLSIHQRQLVTKYIEEDKEALVRNGLKVLCESLHNHHGKKVWILIDEYDAVLNFVYQNPYFSDADLRRTVSLFRALYERAVKGNTFLAKAVLTGCQVIAKASAGSGLNDLEEIDITTPKYAPYYGFSQQEFEEFGDHFGVPKNYLEAAKQWYNGYSVRVYDEEKKQGTAEIDRMYNIWSVISYLMDGDFKKYKSYWADSGSIKFLDDLLCSQNIKNQIERLVDNKNGKFGTIVFFRDSNFSEKDFTVLKEMISSRKVVGDHGMDILFSYLFILGYLTIDGINGHCYRLPNMEIKYEMGTKLINYYQNICHIDCKIIWCITNIVSNIMRIKEPGQNIMKGLLMNFYIQFKELIQSIRLTSDVHNDAGFTSEDLTHSILNNIVLQMQHSTIGSELYASKLHLDKKGRAIIKVNNNNLGMIMEINCEPVQVSNDGHMKEAIQNAMTYCSLLTMKNKIFVAINVQRMMLNPEERAIELLCATYMFDDKDIIGIDGLGNENTF